MEALSVSGDATSFPSEKDRLPPGTLFTRLRIVARMNDVLPGGVLVRPGVSTVEIQTRDLPVVMSRVWDSDEPSRIEQAEAAYERAVTVEVNRRLDRSDLGKVDRVYKETLGLPIARVQEMYEHDQEAMKIYSLRTQAYKEFGDSVEGHFERLFDRSIKPLRAVEVVERDYIPEQLRPASDIGSSLLKSTLSALLEEKLAPYVAENERLKAQLAELQKRK